MKSVALAIEERSPRGIATGIARLITTGDLAPGDRLPTVRDLAIDLGVSPATVSHACPSALSAGKPRPSANSIPRLCMALAMPLSAERLYQS